MQVWIKRIDDSDSTNGNGAAMGDGSVVQREWLDVPLDAQLRQLQMGLRARGSVTEGLRARTLGH